MMELTKEERERESESEKAGDRGRQRETYTLQQWLLSVFFMEGADAKQVHSSRGLPEGGRIDSYTQSTL